MQVDIGDRWVVQPLLTEASVVQSTMDSPKRFPWVQLGSNHLPVRHWFTHAQALGATSQETRVLPEACHKLQT